MVSLTRTGRNSVKRTPAFDRSQTIYAGMVKRREAFHDSNLYRMYQEHAARLGRESKSVRKVSLDFELKRDYLRDLRRREKQSGKACGELAAEVAQEHELPVQGGKVQYPDVRIEYEMPGGEIGRVDLELATASYHAGHIAQKAQAGFVLYASHADAGRLGASANQEQELIEQIFSF